MPKSLADRVAELRALQAAIRDSIRSKKLIAETERLIAQHQKDSDEKD
jgi:hypothetical protein